MSAQQLEAIIRELLEQVSADEIISSVRRSSNKGDGETLTIVPDETTHRIPEEVIRGEKFVMTKGLLNTESSEALNEHLMVILASLIAKLRQQRWRRIYLILSGHSILSVCAKMIAYRITHIETIDLAYFGSKGYFEVNLPTREVVASVFSKEI